MYLCPVGRSRTTTGRLLTIPSSPISPSGAFSFQELFFVPHATHAEAEGATVVAQRVDVARVEAEGARAVVASVVRRPRTNSSRRSSCWPTRRYCCSAGPQQAGITSPCDPSRDYPRTNGPCVQHPKSSRDHIMPPIPPGSAGAFQWTSQPPSPHAMCSNDGRPSRNHRLSGCHGPTRARKARFQFFIIFIQN